jgi:hypothetical protein
MAVSSYSTPAARSSNILSSAANSLANGSEGITVAYDNTTARALYGAITIKLGAFAATTGGSMTLRLTANDGTDTADKVAGDQYVFAITPGSSAKVAILPRVNLYPFSLRFSIINNGGATTAATGNELYIRTYGEEIV